MKGKEEGGGKKSFCCCPKERKKEEKGHGCSLLKTRGGKTTVKSFIAERGGIHLDLFMKKETPLTKKKKGGTPHEKKEKKGEGILISLIKNGVHSLGEGGDCKEKTFFSVWGKKKGFSF